MPRFYFHLHNDMDVSDDEGRELADLAAAKAYAAEHARILIGEMVKDRGEITLSHRIDIEDEDGTVLDTVRWADVLKIEE